MEIRNLFCLDYIRSLIFMWNCLNSEVAKMTLRCYNQHIKYSYGNTDRDRGGEREAGRKAVRERERGVGRGLTADAC